MNSEDTLSPFYTRKLHLCTLDVKDIHIQRNAKSIAKTCCIQLLGRRFLTSKSLLHSIGQFASISQSTCLQQAIQVRQLVNLNLHGANGVGSSPCDTGLQTFCRNRRRCCHYLQLNSRLTQQTLRHELRFSEELHSCPVPVDPVQL